MENTLILCHSFMKFRLYKVAVLSPQANDEKISFFT